MSAKGGASEIAARYATALFDLADEQKQLDRLADDLGALAALIGKSADLRRMMRSPTLGRAAQLAAMDAIMARLKAGDLAVTFIRFVTHRRRLFVLDAMIRAFLAELARRRGEVTAEVIAAQPLAPAQRKALEQLLNKAAGGKVSVNLEIDPALIGGLIVKLGSRMVDASLGNRLQRIEFAMKGA